MDIKLSDDNDILFDNSDNPAVTGEERQDVAQRLTIKLQTYLGEWFLNNTVGVPYHTRVFQKGVKKENVDIIFQSLILEEPDVLSITEFSSTLSPERVYTLSFRVRVASGVTDAITIEV